jgi:hypothetical protein
VGVDGTHDAVIVADRAAPAQAGVGHPRPEGVDTLAAMTIPDLPR